MSVLVREQDRLMVSLTLLFIVILTTVSKVTSLHCSDQQLPASGDGDLQQATTLHYCWVDNCTIITLDTGEKLDIVYTTNSAIVTTLTDGNASVIIAKDKHAFPCDNYTLQVAIVVWLIFNLSISIVISVVIIALILKFKELHTLFGYLLMLYNISLVCYFITATGSVVMEYLVPVYSHAICYANGIINSLTGCSVEVFGTCILHSFAYIMYCSEKLYSIESEDRKRWAKYYIIYYFTNIMIVLVCMLGYDFAKDNIGGIILPNGHCIYIGKHLHGTLLIPITAAGINKTIQLVLFIAYLYYTYLLNKEVTDSTRLERQSSILHKIGIAMGAVVGLTYIMLVAAVTIRMKLIVYSSAVFSIFLLQQFTIMTIFLCSKTMCHKYRKCLSKNQP